MSHDEPTPNEETSDTRTWRYELAESEQPATGVVRAVADATDSDSMAMPPLHEVVDTDALNNLVRGGARRAGNALAVTFSYAGTEVTVDGDGAITVRVLYSGR